MFKSQRSNISHPIALAAQNLLASIGFNTVIPVAGDWVVHNSPQATIATDQQINSSSSPLPLWCDFFWWFLKYLFYCTFIFYKSSLCDAWLPRVLLTGEDWCLQTSHTQQNKKRKTTYRETTASPPSKEFRGRTFRNCHTKENDEYTLRSMVKTYVYAFLSCGDC